MKILVISDTHYSTAAALSVIGRLNPTHIFHLGDMVADAESIHRVFPAIDLRSVRGNNDFAFCVPDEMLVEIDGIRFFLTHGHKYGVKAGTATLAAHAASVGARYALFGHTHQRHDSAEGGVRLMNPSDRGYILIEHNLAEVNKY